MAGERGEGLHPQHARLDCARSVPTENDPERRADKPPSRCTTGFPCAFGVLDEKSNRRFCPREERSFFRCDYCNFLITYLPTYLPTQHLGEEGGRRVRPVFCGFLGGILSCPDGVRPSSVFHGVRGALLRRGYGAAKTNSTCERSAFFGEVLARSRPRVSPAFRHACDGSGDGILGGVLCVCGVDGAACAALLLVCYFCRDVGGSKYIGVCRGGCFKRVPSVMSRPSSSGAPNLD